MGVLTGVKGPHNGVKGPHMVATGLICSDLKEELQGERVR